MANGDVPCGLPVDNRDLGLRAIEHLLELANAIAHARVHVGLGALDVVVQVVSEELNVADCGRSNVRVGEVPREENKGNVANVLRIDEARDMTDL